MEGKEVVRRARALIGVRFRPQGRNLETGLDCIGLVAAAVGVEGVPQDYRLRGCNLADLANALQKAGLRASSPTAPGDVIAMRPGAEQVHLGIWTGSGIIHADARLGRVVERPGPAPWPVLGIWRREK
jgi:lipoprotein Spr